MIICLCDLLKVNALISDLHITKNKIKTSEIVALIL